MAYPKITVNTGIANQVFAHDTIPIPSPNVATITGSGSSVATGNNDIIAVNKLANSTLTGNDLFTATIAPLPVQATQTGDKVYNTTNPGNALVSAVDSGTVLSLDGNPFLSQPVAYLIVRPFHLIDSSANFLTSSVSIGDIVYNTNGFGSPLNGNGDYYKLGISTGLVDISCQIDGTGTIIGTASICI